MKEYPQNQPKGVSLERLVSQLDRMYVQNKNNGRKKYMHLGSSHAFILRAYGGSMFSNESEYDRVRNSLVEEHHLSVIVLIS